MKQKDYYSTLGVLPDADDVVIKAAYRALAQRYHPDKWKGNPSEAHARMSAINAAYHTLGDEKIRKEYDKSRKQSSQQETSYEETSEFSDAFTSALSEVEEQWALASSIYPDLKTLRAGLSKISTSLAFAYVTALLESKEYESRYELAQALEIKFLSRYFGSDPKVVIFAKNLIALDRKDAAKALNKLVDVMGSKIDASLLISRIVEDFGLKKARARAAMERADSSAMQQLIESVRRNGYLDESRRLAELLGYQTIEVGGGLLSACEYRVKHSIEGEISFKTAFSYICWVQDTLC